MLLMMVWEREGGGNQRHALIEGPLLFQTNDPLIRPNLFFDSLESREPDCSHS